MAFFTMSLVVFPRSRSGSDFNVICVGDKCLCVDDDHIALPQDHAPVRDKDPFPPSDEDDDGMSGNIQVTDPVSDPGVALLEDDLLELDVFILIEGLRAEYHHIIRPEDHISPWDEDTVIPLYHCHDDPFRETELGDGLVDPEVPLGQMDLDEMDVRLLAVLAHTLDPGILVNESRGDDTCGDGDHADSEEGDEDPKHFSQRGDGIDIAVTYGEQCGCSPPDSGKCIGKYFRLRLMLQTVHTQAGRQHQDQYREHGREELLLLARQDFCDQFEGVVVGVDPEQAEYPHDPQHSECHCP